MNLKKKKLLVENFRVTRRGRYFLQRAISVSNIIHIDKLNVNNNQTLEILNNPRNLIEPDNECFYYSLPEKMLDEQYIADSYAGLHLQPYSTSQLKELSDEGFDIFLSIDSNIGHPLLTLNKDFYTKNTDILTTNGIATLKENFFSFYLAETSNGVVQPIIQNDGNAVFLLNGVAEFLTGLLELFL